MAKPDPLFVLRLAVEGYMRVEAVLLDTAGTVIELKGANRAGKTSALDAIWAAIGGERYVPDDPIHDGLEEASIAVDVGDAEGVRYTVTRHFSRKEKGRPEFTTRLRIKNAEGHTEGAQAMLNGWVSTISMDPMKFLGMKPELQADTLRQLVGLDTSEIDKARARAFEKRTLVNRDVATHEGAVASISLLTPPEPVDVAELLAQQQQAEKLAQDEDARQRAITNAERNADEWQKQIETAKAALAEAQAELDYALQQHGIATELQSEANAAAAIDVPDREAIRAKIASAGEINARVAQAAATKLQKEQAEARLKASTAESEELTKEIKRLAGERAKAIAACKMPIAGLAISEANEVMFAGRALSAASRAERIKVAFAIAMASNPRLRVLVVHDVDLLDDETRAEMLTVADEFGIQLFLESVRSSNPAAIEIVAGRVKEAA